MYISDATYNKINELLTLTFQMNSFTDNVAYNLADKKIVNAEKIFHENFAHKFPQLADEISELMLRLNTRPVRGPLNANTKMYNGLPDMFDDLLEEIRKYRGYIIQTIEIAEYNDDYEVKIFIEEYLNNFTVYLHQAEIWAKKAREYAEDQKGFDKDFAIFTLID